MCENLKTTSEVTDDPEKMNTSFNEINSWNYVGISARYAETAPLQCTVKSGFTTLMNKRAWHIISTPCVLH